MQINIPLGSKISKTNENTIEMKIPNTRSWILGVQKESKKWDIYITNPKTKSKEIVGKNLTTKHFCNLSNKALATPFPYSGKRSKNKDLIKKFIKKLIKKQNNE